MNVLTILLVLLVLSTAAYFVGQRQALIVGGGSAKQLHSLPSYHGFYAALWSALPSIVLLIVWLIAEPHIAESVLRSNLPQAYSQLSDAELDLRIGEVKRLATGNIVGAMVSPELQAAADSYTKTLTVSRIAMIAAMAGLVGFGFISARKRISLDLRARNQVERVTTVIMFLASLIAILTTVGIVLSLLFETGRFFAKVPFWEFLFGIHWSPQTALRAEQVGSTGAFGAIPLFAGTMLITVIAMLVAVPVGLFSAIFMSEYASPRVRAIAKPLLEVLAGIPTVVYGFFAALAVAPFFRGIGDSIGLDVSSESALAAGMVMGIMIIPFVSSLSDDVMNAVPQTLRDGSYALGATRSETIRQVILPAALPGIVGAVLLAASRAIGETMIVVMAAGLAANLTANPLEAVTTVTVQIVTLLTGDQEFDSAKTLAAFALGLVLFAVTLCLNVYALHIVRKYREKYD